MPPEQPRDELQPPRDPPNVATATADDGDEIRELGDRLANLTLAETGRLIAYMKLRWRLDSDFRPVDES